MNHSLPTIWLKPAQFAAFTATGTTAHRIATNPDGWIERLGDDALVCFKNDATRDTLVNTLTPWITTAGWQPRRIFAKFLPRQNQDRIAPVLLSGDSTPSLTTTITEAGASYALDFAAGYSHGLFLDQRSNRTFLSRVSPKHVLNTFSYTCAFSVAAALAGAQTLSVDLSKKSLERGRENFALNQIDTSAHHRFIADDVLDVLPRLIHRGEKFDAIILDPPTFSRGNQGRRWQIEQHLEDLLSTAMELATPKAHILLSTNCTSLTIRDLETMARYCCKLHRRPVNFHRESQQTDFPPGHGATTLWLV